MKKILVIGSSGHHGVSCVSWQDASSTNLVDFDFVVVNTASLTEQVLKTFKEDEFCAIRQKLARLLASRGHIVVLANRRITVQRAKADYTTNYGWCPLVVGTEEEAGTTIEVTTSEFPRYLTQIKRWSYLFFLPQEALTREFVAVCGDPRQYNYRLNPAPLVSNRYSKNVAISYSFLISPPGVGNPMFTGTLSLLPLVPELEERTSIKTILEDITGVSQTTSMPEWAEAIVMPGVGKINAEIDGISLNITSLEKDLDAARNRKASREEYKKLLYETDSELENVFAAALEFCGGKIGPAKYSNEEFILEHAGRAVLVECKGVGKSISLSNLRQLLDYMLKYEEDEGLASTGLLLGNAWRNLSPEQRDSGETPIFPKNVVDRAKQVGMALVSSVDFFEIFGRVLEGEVAGAAVLDRIVNSVGRVDFSDL